MSRSARPAARTVVGAVLGSVLVTGCGSASEPSPPTGVDELTIPSPSLDPDDFGDEVDNPWLPLEPGSEWVYRSAVTGTDVIATVAVLEETREIQGVTATAVRTTVDRGRGAVDEGTVDWFAQDDAGNVWHVAEEGRWEAGADGAEAGLAMPARPRVGDGYRTELAAGVAEGRAQVVALDSSASTPYGDLTDLLETEVTSLLDPVVVQRLFYARGIGLVRGVTTTGGDADLVLVRFSSG